MLRLTLIFSLLSLAAVGFSIRVASNTTTKTEYGVQNKRVTPSRVDPPGTIDGATTPEKIPDHVAYLALFRMVSNRRTASEQNAIRSYLKYTVGLDNQRTGQSCSPSLVDKGTDIANFLAAAEDFYKRVSVLDRTAAGIKNEHWPNPTPEVMNQLAELQRQKEAIVKDVAASLRQRLSANGYNKLIRHMSEHVKRHTKMTPAPSLPPANWHSHTSTM